MSVVYEINKGINRPLEFKGLRAQYIWWLAAGLGILLVLFSIGYIVGVNLYVCIGITGVLGCGLFSQVYRLSRTYGTHGLMKLMAHKKVPSAIIADSRRFLEKLRND